MHEWMNAFNLSIFKKNKVAEAAAALHHLQYDFFSAFDEQAIAPH